MNTVTRLGRERLTGNVRVGIAVASLEMEHWQAEVISSLLSDPAILISSIFMTGETATEPKPLLLNAYEGWSARVAAPFRAVNLTSALSEVPKITFCGTAEGALLEDDRASIRAQSLDVLLWLTSRRTLDCFGLARHGVWSFALGTLQEERYKSPFMRELIDGDPTSRLLLVEHTCSLFEGQELTCQVTATKESWYITLAAAEALRNAGTMLVRRLLDLVSLPETSGSRKSIAFPDVSTSYPSTSSLLGYVGRQILRSTKARLRSRGRHLRWFVTARRDHQLVTSNSFTVKGFEAISGGIEEADPFVVEWKGQEAVFVEEVPRETGRGRISCHQVQGGKFSSLVPVMERPYHVSYPHIFSANHDLFMIPETSANRTVELYRCLEFPLRWELEKVLCEGVPLVDTNALFHEGTWYFFTTALETGELLLFYADALDGAWIYHPQNPISMDVRQARNAGAFFIAGSKLIRPAQDSSVRYGYAIVLNEVVSLSREHYEEIPIRTILPDWQPGLLGTHTFNSNREWQVIDGLELAP